MYDHFKLRLKSLVDLITMQIKGDHEKGLINTLAILSCMPLCKCKMKAMKKCICTMFELSVFSTVFVFL